MKEMENKTQLVKRELTIASPLRIREGEGSRIITGYAILFNTESAPLWRDEESEAREVIAPEAITREFLDGCDIKMTMFHDRQLILARSKNGEGTLKYNVDEKGVYFEFEAPNTCDGDKALELVKRGDLAGCSFAFSTYYWDDSFVERTSQMVGDICKVTYRVKAVTGVYDFTLASDPAYPDTSVEAREFVENLKPNKADQSQEPKKAEREKKIKEQVSEMRNMAHIK